VAEAIRTFVAVDAGVGRDVVEHALPRGPEIELVGVVEGLEDSWTMLQETPNDLLVVACAGYSDRALFLIESAVSQRPHRPVVVLNQGAPDGFLQRLFEAGADDVLMLPMSSEEIRFALQKAIARKAGEAGVSGGTAPLICVLGPKGGTGKTLTATNLAVALQQQGSRVVVVDIDLQFGDVGLCLGLDPENTIYDLVRVGGSLDEEKLSDFLVTHPSGVRVLLAPTRPDQAALVTVEFLRDVYSVLRRMFDYVVVDTPPGFTPEVIATIDAGSGFCMVGMLDSLSLKNTKLGLETLELMGVPRDQVKVVLNRAQTRVGISHDDVVAIMGRQPDAFVPSDREIPRAVNEGVPIMLAKPQSDAAEAFRALALQFQTTDEPVESTRGLRRLILRRA
jgi:pilus assembly protein CpaE